MIRRLSIVALVVSLLCAACSTRAVGQQFTWPQWRGPDRTGVSKETGLLKQWPEGGPKQLWLFRDAGVGYSGPAVVGDKLFIMGARDETELLLCIDTEKGAESWSAEIGPIYRNGWGDGPRGTPTVDGDVVYAMGAQGNLICARVSDGSIVWKTSMRDFGGRTPNWGYCESVLVDGEKLICTPGGAKGAILALNKKNGEQIWQSEDFTDGAEHSSLVVGENGGKRQYIALTMRHTAGVAAENGELLWESSFPGRTAVVPTPIFSDGHVYVTSGYGSGCKLVKLSADNTATEVYSSRNMSNHHGGVIKVGDHLFGYADGRGWVCQDFQTGDVAWNERSKLGKGCLTCADGMLYCMSEGDGTVVLVEASTEGWNEHGRFRLDPQTTLRKPSGRIWTHPVVVDGRLYLRDQDLLFCFDVRQQ